MATRPGFRALAELEMKSLHLGHDVPAPPEHARRQFVQVVVVLALFLGQHAAFAGTDRGSGNLGAASHGGLCFLRQRAEAHVGNEHRHGQRHRALRVWAQYGLAADWVVVEQRPTRELRSDQLDVIPLR